ncbi:porin, partial [Herbaspirillum sp. HC18]
DGASETVEAGPNQLKSTNSANRVVVTVGKFGLTDVFDTNKYAHDPRTDFLNWSVIDTGSFDWAADAWGYTYGIAAEWYWRRWAFRAGVFDLPTVPNSTDLDPTFSQVQWVGEVERRYDLWGQPGKIAF